MALQDFSIYTLRLWDLKILLSEATEKLIIALLSPITYDLLGVENN